MNDSLPTMTSNLSVQNARRALVASVVLTGLLWVMPYGHLIGRPLLWLSTLAHELGHGFTAIAVGANFNKFQMFANGSGVASYSGHPGAIGKALISAGGLIGPAIVAAGCFLAARTERGARIILGMGAGLMALVLLLWANNLFTAAFLIVFGGMLFFIARKADEGTARVALMFLGVQLGMSVFSRSDYLFMGTAHTSAGAMPSDVAKISLAIGMPYWFWGGLIGLASVAVVGAGLWFSVGPAQDEF